MNISEFDSDYSADEASGLSSHLVARLSVETDEMLVRRFVQQGEAAAFAALADRYMEMVYNTCRRILRDEAEAADATQETFFQFLKNARHITGSTANWLHRVATRRAVDLIRQNSARRRREQRYSREVSLQRGSVLWAEAEPLVDEAMEQLPAELRELLVLHFLKRQTMTQIAAAKRMSQPTVSRRVAEGLNLLRENLRQQGVALGFVPVQAILLHTSQAVPETLSLSLAKMALAKAAQTVPAATTAAPIASAGAKVGLAGLSLTGAAVLLCFLVGGARPPLSRAPAQTAATPAGLTASQLNNENSGGSLSFERTQERFADNIPAAGPDEKSVAGAIPVVRTQAPLVASNAPPRAASPTNTLPVAARLSPALAIPVSAQVRPAMPVLRPPLRPSLPLRGNQQALTAGSSSSSQRGLLKPDALRTTGVGFTNTAPRLNPAWIARRMPEFPQRRQLQAKVVLVGGGAGELRLKR